MDRIEPTRALAFKIWWALIWRVTLFALAAGIALAVIFALLHFAIGLPTELFDVLSLPLMLAAGIGIWIEVIYRVLRRKFRDFEIALIHPQN